MWGTPTRRPYDGALEALWVGGGGMVTRPPHTKAQHKICKVKTTKMKGMPISKFRCFSGDESRVQRSCDGACGPCILFTQNAWPISGRLKAVKHQGAVCLLINNGTGRGMPSYCHTMRQDTGGSHDGAKQESSKNTLHLKFLMAGAAVFAS